MPRFPPTLGVVGFDFGTKPAFSVAAAIVGVPLKQQDDYQGPPCLEVYGPSIALVSSLIASCGCYSRFPDFDQKVTILGTVNGSFSLTYVPGTSGFEAWLVDAVDTATIETYDSADGTCSGSITHTEVETVRWEIDCAGGAVFNVVAAVNNTSIQLYNAGANPPSGVALPNVFTCDGLTPAGGGFATWG